MPRVAACLVLSCLTGAAAQTSAPLDAICSASASADGPGFTVIVSKDGDVVHRAAYGLADLAARTPLRVEQPFYVASIAKSLTAACVVHLARAGVVGLDDEVRTYVPELPEHSRGITLRHLLHHRSGLRDFYELELLASRKPTALTTRGVLDLLRRQRGVNFAPGADFLYCNSGYLLLAEVVARASGQSLRAYAQEHLFRPLAMTASAFRDEAHPDVEGLPVAYANGTPSAEPPLLCGAGGLCTSAEDLHAWLTALAGGTWQPELVRELMTPPVLSPDQRRSPQLNPYAGGVFVTTLGREPATMMFGGFLGWQAAALALPRARVQVVLLANTDVNALGIVRQLARSVIGEEEAPRPVNEAVAGFAAYRSADGELLFHATRRSGPSFLTTLGWKVEVAEQAGAIRSFGAGTALMARRADDGALELTVEGETMRRYAPVAMAKVEAADVDALAGTWHGGEIDADIQLRAESGKLVIDSSRMVLPIAPFQAIDRDTWISDTGMQIDVQRATDGKPVGLRCHTSRARGLQFARR
jgi:CubicO group peptidase (beta-lactamase class C family)